MSTTCPSTSTTCRKTEQPASGTSSTSGIPCAGSTSRSTARRHAAQDNWVEETDGPPAWQFWREDHSAAEYERIEEEYGVTKEEIEAWRENDKDYTEFPEDQPGEDAPQSEKDAWNEEYEAYREQPLEEDAFEEGDEFVDGITPEELRQYQLDAGVPVIS